MPGKERQEMASVPNTDEYMQRCICGKCASYPGDVGLYCARGKSANVVHRSGCICVDCENFKEYALSRGYYCAEGSAEQMEV